MAMNYSFAFAAMVCSFAIVWLPADPASARIKCKNGYQIVDGNRLATPFCQDNYLAQVAREYGTRVSAREIRNNPNKKREICEFIGQDIRVRHNCETITPQGRGGTF
jgi:hypothetical protein